MIGARRGERTSVESTGADGQSKVPSVFISYSRSEAPLAQYVNDQLQDRGFDPWLDFKDLRPGELWDEQLKQAVSGADAAVLIISRRSVSSEHVSDEWTAALDQGKRLVLLVFEAVPLPEELSAAKCEWVDFRTDFYRAAHHLGALLQRPYEAATELPPDQGFRAPLRVWLAFLASIGTAILSVTVLWSVFVPLALLPLPSRMLRRSFDYRQVRMALIFLPAMFYSTQAVLDPASYDLDSAWDTVFFASLMLSVALWLLMRGGSFRVWVQPAAFRPHRAASHLKTTELDHSVTPISYALDAAPQDQPYADRLSYELESSGHRHVEALDADIELRLISSFNDAVELTPGRVTLPVLVADPDDELPRELSRTQWIDVRRGLKTRLLETVSRLIDDPDLLMRTIGVPPPHDQKVLPTRIYALTQALWIGIAVVVGFGVMATLSLRDDLSSLFDSGGFILYLATAPILAWAMWRTIRSMETRRPRRWRSAVFLVYSAAFFGLLTIADSVSELLPSDEAGETTGDALALVPGLVAISLLVLWLFSIKQLRDWMPSHRLVLDERAGATAHTT